MKKVKLLLIASLGLVFFLFPHFAQAWEFKLAPEKDTWVDSAYPEANFSNLETLTTGFSWSSKIIFLKFDLNRLPSDFLNPETGNELGSDTTATLQLTLKDSVGEKKNLEAELLLPNQDWNEDQITWNNKPSLFPSGFFASLTATPGAQLIEFNGLVNSWLSGVTDNFGLAIYHNLNNFERTYWSNQAKKDQPVLVFKNNLLAPIPNPSPSPSPWVLPSPTTPSPQIAENYPLEVSLATETASFLGPSPEPKKSPENKPSPWLEINILTGFNNWLNNLWESFVKMVIG